MERGMALVKKMGFLWYSFAGALTGLPPELVHHDAGTPAATGCSAMNLAPSWHWLLSSETGTPAATGCSAVKLAPSWHWLLSSETGTLVALTAQQ